MKVSVLVLTYKPEWEKLKKTLGSILLQRDCDFDIVVSDDGSENNYFDVIETFFEQNNFHKYQLSRMPQNAGIVKNAMNGVAVSKAEYIKFISPGDMLHGIYALRDWVNYMDRNRELAMSFCDVIFYHMENDRMIFDKQYAHPQCPEAYNDVDQAYHYLLANDICLGASTMCRTDKLSKYLTCLVGKVIFAEDNVYRLMVYRGERIGYFSRSALLYEYGTGISTSQDNIWGERIHNDWECADKIMIDGECYSEKFKDTFKKFKKYSSKRDFMSRMKRSYIRSKKLGYKIKRKVFTRYTSMDIDKKYIRLLEQF